jgi:hypothetical protein
MVGPASGPGTGSARADPPTSEDWDSTRCGLRGSRVPSERWDERAIFFLSIMITGLWDDEAVEMKHLGVRKRLAAWGVTSEPHLLLE